MPKLTAIDEIYIQAKPEQIFAVIADYAHMNDWFPKYRCSIIDANEISEGCEVMHYVGEKRVLSKFKRRINKIIKGKRLEESYIEGDLIGTGIWRFDEEDQGTRVSYDCTVKGNSFASNIGILLTGAKMHKQFYQDLLEHLKAHIESS